MTKNSYSSGFLYHPGSQQYLLEQQNSTQWSLLKISHLSYILLKLKQSPKDIHAVYKYFHQGLKKNHQVSYAKARVLKDLPPKEKTIFAWFTHKQISKSTEISSQTKQDLIVGQRVIDSQIRKSSGERTIG